MAKPIKHPTVAGATNETHPKLFAEDGTPKTPETHPRLFNKDGTPIDFAARMANRRPVEELLKTTLAQKEAALARHAKELAGLDKRIAFYQSGGKVSRSKVDPAAANAAAQALATKGIDPSQFAALAEQFRLAAAAVKGKTEDEVAALVAPPFTAATAPQLATV